MGVNGTKEYKISADKGKYVSVFINLKTCFIGNGSVNLVIEDSYKDSQSVILSSAEASALGCFLIECAEDKENESEDNKGVDNV